MTTPHYLAPSHKTAHVCIFYRNFQKGPTRASHIGLGVSALHTCRVLRKQRIQADPYGIWNAYPTKDYPESISTILERTPTCTHAVIEALFISVADMSKLLTQFPQVEFVCRNHSQVGFLQVEAGAVNLLREYLTLQDGSLNFKFAGNSDRFAKYVESVYHSPCLLLPNLYDFDRAATKIVQPPFDHRTIRIASLGALRLLKNHSTAAAAAQLIARSRNCNLEFYLSVNREEHGKGILQMIRNMYANLKWAKLFENPWESWPDFRKTVSHMDLCLQISFTETFNITTADACAELVPSVVGDCIEWLPDHWKANTDDAVDVARVGNMLLQNPSEVLEGNRYLRKYVRQGTDRWVEFLNGERVSNSHLDW